MVKYQILLVWNDTVVLSGEASAVVTWHNVRRLMIDNFAKLETREISETMVPSLVALINVEIGRNFEGKVSDETGSASFGIQRIE